MNTGGIPEKPLIASLNPRPNELVVQPVYFVQRASGDVIYVDERSAWGLLKDRTNKLYGVGDGKIFYDGLREAQEIGKVKGITFAQERLRKAVQDEMDASVSNKKMPRNFDRTDNWGNPTNI